MGNIEVIPREDLNLAKAAVADHGESYKHGMMWLALGLGGSIFASTCMCVGVYVWRMKKIDGQRQRKPPLDNQDNDQ